MIIVSSQPLCPLWGIIRHDLELRWETDRDREVGWNARGDDESRKCDDFHRRGRFH